ncbi:PREDICTED: diuretic hormone receptor-like isoform X3 [Trachymyrmex septentrionalis]|uniref:diuretic hormone receptor-like isoform X3 n=1 Tax=Trachymyrmex septentrionalis TaxID=34720 RepID=UPI00084F7297|nr:PREDICTED: diuretic hormone receptor-like isoform X3 [Trachymyrmex septentrionalis]
MAWFPINGTKPLVGGNYVLNALNYINELNESFNAEQHKCLEREQEHENQKQERQECEMNWDTILCWPRTISGTLASIPCFDELNGISYDNTQNASRWCWPNGTWDNYSNYSMCRDVRLPTIEAGIEITTTLYFIGYSLSLFTLIMAVCIFIYYKELRCLRNNIHTNLMFTYILADLTWILTTAMQVSMQTDIPTCVILFSLLHYFHLTNFFWMFIEGLYLYLLVVKTFTGDNIKLRLCLVIGWGIPVLVIAMWGIAKSLDQKIMNHIMNQPNQEVVLWRHCPWMTPHPYDWFYQASAVTVLAVNMIFLFMIMRGFFVALFYCFLNTEVQNTVRHHFARWSTTRNLESRRRYYNNWSPRSRTESIRLCQPSNPYRKRESTVSETTTTTVIGLNSTTTFHLDKSKGVISEALNE